MGKHYNLYIIYCQEIMDSYRMLIRRVFEYDYQLDKSILSYLELYYKDNLLLKLFKYNLVLITK